MRDDFKGLSYSARHTLVASEGKALTIYVPTLPSELTVAPHSGIVGQPWDDDLVRIDYEGWVHGAAQYQHLDVRGRWEAAVVHAAGRAFVEYPTIARRVVPLHLLQPVGKISAATNRLRVTDEAAVAQWLATSR